MNYLTKKASLLGIELPISDRKEILEMTLRHIKKSKRTCVFTPNTQMLLNAEHDTALTDALHKADILVPDGSGIKIGLALLGIRTPERLSGIMYGEDILRLAEQLGLSVFFLGGKPSVARRAATALHRRLPGLKIVGTQHGYFTDNCEVINKINGAKPDILFVCLGSPRQEKWCTAALPRLPSVRLLTALGGSLDVWSGDKKRSPRVFQELSLEWLWRLLHEPRRIRILADIPVFLIKVLKQKCRVA